MLGRFFHVPFKISEYSQENASWSFFLIKLQACRPYGITSFSYRTPPVVASTDMSLKVNKTAEFFEAARSCRRDRSEGAATA